MRKKPTREEMDKKIAAADAVLAQLETAEESAIADEILQEVILEEKENR